MTTTASTDDDGFGLVEAVVSMLILAALAIAFLPVLLTGLKQSTTNSTSAFATQLVGERMSLAQAATSCSTLALAVTGGQQTDARGSVVEITTTMSPATCTARGTYTVTSTARLVEGGTPGSQLASASTIVYVVNP